MVPSNLSTFAAKVKRKILADLSAKRPPSVGRFDVKALQQAFLSHDVQMGTTVFYPDKAVFEYIFRISAESSQILAVEVEVPERIVFLPVPEWVVETIWQGDVDGSYHFESHARELIAKYESLTRPGDNAKFFGRQAAKHRE